MSGLSGKGHFKYQEMLLNCDDECSKYQFERFACCDSRSQAVSTAHRGSEGKVCIFTRGTKRPRNASSNLLLRPCPCPCPTPTPTQPLHPLLQISANL